MQKNEFQMIDSVGVNSEQEFWLPVACPGTSYFQK